MIKDPNHNNLFDSLVDYRSYPRTASMKTFIFHGKDIEEFQGWPDISNMETGTVLYSVETPKPKWFVIKRMSNSKKRYYKRLEDKAVPNGYKALALLLT